MLDLYEELTSLIAVLDEKRIEYALCGGLAMAVWGYPRATVDIDIVIQSESLAATQAAAESLGYTIRARPMTFSAGAIVIHRISKIDPNEGDTLMLDMLLVTEAIADVWDDRAWMEWERGSICVVSRPGMVKLKTFRSSGLDLDDIERLQASE